MHLRRARDHADVHYAEPLELAALADVAGMSKFHFLLAKGVEFVQPPEERPYGVEAVARDNSGNWMVLVESRAFTAADFA